LIRKQIRDYLLLHRASDEPGDFSDNDSLLELGVIDSLVMIDLIAHIESTYSIKIDEDDMVPEHFDSIDAIVAYIQAKT